MSWCPTYIFFLIWLEAALNKADATVQVQNLVFYYASSSSASLFLSSYQLIVLNTHQSTPAPLWSPFYIHFSAKKKDANKRPRSGPLLPAKPTLFHYLLPIILLSTCSVEQCSTGVQGGGFWQDGNMMTHQSPDEKNPPSARGHVSRPGRGSSPFLWLILPPATTIKLPSAAGTLISPLSELSLHSSSFFVRGADHVSLLTPLCSTVATGKTLPLFSSEMSWKYNSLLFSEAFGLRALVSLVKTGFFFVKKPF